MILVWGNLTDEPVVRILEALDDGLTEVVHLDDSLVADLTYDLEMAPAPAGSIDVGELHVELDRIQGWYLRPGGTTSAAAAVLLAVAGGLPATVPVVNRPAAGRSNNSKPYQGVLLTAAGLHVPATYVTSDPDAAREFLTRHRRVVYKSISGIRSVVAAVEHMDELGRVGHGPVQLQEWIDGLDVRVHVVGNEWFATSVESEATDYRYGGDVVMAPLPIPQQLGNLLVKVTADMGLLVAGVDLRRTPGGGWYCFEVNPSPGFTFYEDHTGQPIAAAISRLLRGHS